jgi:CBS domain-containing protein
MTPIPLAVADEDTTAEDIAHLVEQRGIRCVPVLSRGVLVGIVSRADLVRAVLQARGAADAAERDNRIEREIIARMRQQPWNVARWLTVRVRDGVVQLHGFCNSEAVRHALCVLAQSVDGVRRVEDRMEDLPFRSGL